jgi:hypothetical protein
VSSTDLQTGSSFIPSKYFNVTFAVKSRITGKKKIFDFPRSPETESLHKIGAAAEKYGLFPE